MTRATQDLYAADLCAWADEQVSALRENRMADLDRVRMAGVVARLGWRERRVLRARIGVVLTGMLRWAQEVDLRCHGWAVTLDKQRYQIERLLRDNPSLGADLPTLVAEIYPLAKARAVLESGLFDDSFSEGCPFTDDEILTVGCYPDPYGDDAVRGIGWWRRDRGPARS